MNAEEFVMQLTRIYRYTPLDRAVHDFRKGVFVNVIITIDEGTVANPFPVTYIFYETEDGDAKYVKLMQNEQLDFDYFLRECLQKYL